MAKLCPRGKAAAKRKFKVYPSAYANMYASAVCSGKVTPGGKKNRKKKAEGGLMSKNTKRRSNVSYTKENGKYYDKKGRELDVSLNRNKSGGTSRISLKKDRSRPKRFSEGGMVMEDMTTMIEV